MVSDTTPPMIMGCPGDITVDNDPGECGAVVSWSDITVSDNSGSSSLINNIAPGSTFPIGTTAVVYTATDDAGKWFCLYL